KTTALKGRRSSLGGATKMSANGRTSARKRAGAVSSRTTSARRGGASSRTTTGLIKRAVNAVMR
ncbi:MAG TPA: hypothetical protein VM598_05655, partial [Bdellovibrionota bacterium]|nr:hypothetical protein [Bdellovibrionota bacterium]